MVTEPQSRVQGEPLIGDRASGPVRKAVPFEHGHGGGGVLHRRPRASGSGHRKGPVPFLILLALVFGTGGCGPAEKLSGALDGHDSGASDAERGAAALDEALSAAADPERLAESVKHLEAGLALRASGDTAGAIREFRKAIDAGPALADWGLALIAETYAVSAQREKVDETVALLPTGLRDAWAWRARARAAVRANHGDVTIRIVEQVLPGLEAASDSAEAFRLRGEARASLGDTAAARAELRLALATAPTSGAARAAAVRLTSFGLPEEVDHHALTRYFLATRDLPGARRVLAQALRSPGGDPSVRGELRLDIAEALIARGSAIEAERILGEVASSSAGGAQRARALLLMGRVRLRQGKMAESRARLEEAARFADTPAGQEAHFILGDLAQDAGQVQAARRHFLRATHSLPGTEWGAEAAVRVGTLFFLEGDAPAATAVFEGYRTAHPDGWRNLQATYWAALAYRELGDTAMSHGLFRKVAADDPVSFYGIGAAQEVGLSPIRDRLPPGPAADPLVDRLALGGLARLEALRALRLDEFASVESAMVRAHLARRPGGVHALAEVLHAQGRLLEAVRLGRTIRTSEGGWDVRSLRIVFPFPYQNEILTAADRHGIDPFLMAGLIRQESLFEPTALSSAGAVGLMQLLPRTARDLASRDGIERVDAQTLRDVDVNVSLGALHLRELLRRHGDSVADLLIEYNAGSGRLSRWKRHPEYGHPAVFVERIPYRETREYVRTVTENFRIYEAIYGETTPRPRALAAEAATER